MSNYDLQRTVSQLESQLRQIESANRALQGEINQTVGSINQAERALSDYNQHIRNTLDNATNTIDNSVNKALAAYELQGEIDKLYKRYKHVELANKKIRALNNKKYYDFNNYRTVRKIVQGIMDNLDLNMVSDRVIYKSVEKEHLKTPDFWLTCALISIMAWKNDDKALAERAIENAVKLDKKNTSIFLMIFNLRMERNTAAAKWFMQYQQCDLTGSDESTFLMLFSLVSETLTKNVDSETAEGIRDFINSIIIKNAQREGYDESTVVDMIYRNLLRLRQAQSFELPLLSRYCSAYNEMLNMLNLAACNFRILEFILKIINVPIDEKNTYLKEFLNELLAKPNDNELETYDEIEYNELIIRLSGDVEAAKSRFEEQKLRRESQLDLIRSMIEWIYDFSDENVNGQMRKNMFVLVKDFQEKAVQKHINIYRSKYRNALPIQIDEYSATVDFAAEAQELNKVNQYYEQKTRDEIASIKNLPAYIMFGLGAAGCVAAFFTHFAVLGLGAVGGIGGLVYMLGNKRKKKNIRLRNQEGQRVVQETMRNLFVEFATFKQTYTELDAVSDKILDEFAKLK